MEPVGFVSVVFQHVAQLPAEVVDVVGNHVCQAVVLGLVPNVLDGIKVGRVRRQPFDSHHERCVEKVSRGVPVSKPKEIDLNELYKSMDRLLNTLEDSNKRDRAAKKSGEDDDSPGAKEINDDGSG